VLRQGYDAATHFRQLQSVPSRVISPDLFFQGAFCIGKPDLGRCLVGSDQRFIVNMDEEVTQILDLMGPAFEKYYFVRSTREM
jgi:hypothetical protein